MTRSRSLIIAQSVMPQSHQVSQEKGGCGAAQPAARNSHGRKTDMTMRTKKSGGEGLPVRWKGEVARFSRMREGGPGRPVTLAIITGIGCTLLILGQLRLDANGISSAGPMMLLFGICTIAFVVLWGGFHIALRDRLVTFVVDARGVAIRPSKAQRLLDKRMFWLSMFQFWTTWRGGIWTPWVPVTRWKEVRSVEYFDHDREILVRGGEWDIRLMCTADNYLLVREVIMARASR